MNCYKNLKHKSFFSFNLFKLYFTKMLSNTTKKGCLFKTRFAKLSW